jgi:hypothetical protein
MASRPVRKIGWFVAGDIALILILFAFGLVLSAMKIPIEGHPILAGISNENGTQWFGEITQFAQYRDLVDWAIRSRDAGALLPLPKEFQGHTLHPFRM